MLTILMKGKKEGSPTGFLTNDDGNVFPVFGGKYTPKNLERHREIVQKIHDNTTDPAKKAKHAEYLKTLDGARQGDGEPALNEMSDSEKRLHDLVAKHEMAYGLGTGRTPTQRLEYLRDENLRAAEIHKRHAADAERPRWSEPTALDKKRVEDSREAAKQAERIAEIASKRLAHRRENPNATFVAPTLPHGDYGVTDKDKIALSFSKSDFDDLEPALKERLRRFYNWSPKSSSWISKARSSDDNAHRIAVEAGFSRPEKKDIKQIERKLPEAKPVEGLGEGKWHKASAEDVNPKTALAAYQNTSWTPEERAAREGGNHVEAMDYAVSQLEKLATTPEKQALLKSMLEDYRPKLLEKHHAYLASRSRLASSAITGPSNFPVQQMERRGDIVHNKLGDYLQFQDDSINRMRKILTSDLDGGPIMSHHADAIPRLQEKLAKAEEYQEKAKALNKIVKSAKMSDEEKVAKIVNDLGFSEATARKALTPDSFGNIGVAAYALTNNNANIRRIKEQIADIQKRYNLEKGEGATMRLFMLKGTKAKGSPTGFLTNEDGNVFPVFGGNYRPKNLEKHREIVQKIHDNTRDPVKKAKHAEYLKSLDGGVGEGRAPIKPDISRLSPWKKGSFEIQKGANRAESAKRFKESVSGWTSKHFGVHKATAPKGVKHAEPYTITHIKTGLSIGMRAATLERAQALASALEHHGGDAWDFSDTKDAPLQRWNDEGWAQKAHGTASEIQQQRAVAQSLKAAQTQHEVGDKINTAEVKPSHGGRHVWNKEKASEIDTEGGRFVTDGRILIFEPGQSAGANPMGVSEREVRKLWSSTVSRAKVNPEATLDSESFYAQADSFASKSVRDRIPVAHVRDDAGAYPVNVPMLRWAQKRTGATALRLDHNGTYAAVVLYRGADPVGIVMSRKKAEPMQKGEGKRQPSGFITVGGGKEEGGHVIPVFGHAPSEHEGKITVTTAGGKEYDIDEDKHEAIKAKIKRHQAEAAGQGKLFSERGKPTEKAKEAGSREAPPKKEATSKPQPAPAGKPAAAPAAQEKAKAVTALYDHVTDFGSGHMGDALANLGDKKRILSDLQDAEHEHADLVEKHWDHARSEVEDRIRKASDEQTASLSDEEKEAQGLPVNKKTDKPTQKEPPKPEPSSEDAIKSRVDAKLAEVAERSRVLGEKFKAERVEKAKKEADAASPEEIKAYLEKATDAYLKTHPLEKEKVEAFKAKQSSTPAKEQGSGDEPWGRPYKDRLVGDVYKEKQALRDMMNADNMTQQQMRDFQNIGVRLEGQYDKRSFDEAVTADREAMRQLRARLTGSGKGEAGPVTVKPAGPKKEVEAKNAGVSKPTEGPVHEMSPSEIRATANKYRDAMDAARATNDSVGHRNAYDALEAHGTAEASFLSSVARLPDRARMSRSQLVSRVRAGISKHPSAEKLEPMLNRVSQQTGRIGPANDAFMQHGAEIEKAAPGLYREMREEQIKRWKESGHGPDAKPFVATNAAATTESPLPTIQERINASREKVGNATFKTAPDWALMHYELSAKEGTASPKVREQLKTLYSKAEAAHAAHTHPSPGSDEHVAAVRKTTGQEFHKDTWEHQTKSARDRNVMQMRQLAEKSPGGVAALRAVAGEPSTKAKAERDAAIGRIAKQRARDEQRVGAMKGPWNHESPAAKATHVDGKPSVDTLKSMLSDIGGEKKAENRHFPDKAALGAILDGVYEHAHKAGRLEEAKGAIGALRKSAFQTYERLQARQGRTPEEDKVMFAAADAARAGFDFRDAFEKGAKHPREVESTLKAERTQREKADKAAQRAEWREAAQNTPAPRKQK